MRSVGAYQAKTHLPELLEAVRGGETVTITRHGNPIAVLRPIEPARDRAKVAETILALNRFRKGRALGADVRSLIDEGRR
jgi:prevent-host-death family protein